MIKSTYSPAPVSLREPEAGEQGQLIFPQRDDDMIDITAISSVDRCAQAAPMDVLDMDGQELGFQFMVLGAQAEAVQKYTNKLVNDEFIQQEMARKKGKPPKQKTMEEVVASNIEAALIRIVDWVGVKQKFEKDVLRDAIKNNPHWVNQVIEFSNDLRNFTKAS